MNEYREALAAAACRLLVTRWDPSQTMRKTRTCAVFGLYSFVGRSIQQQSPPYRPDRFGDVRWVRPVRLRVYVRVWSQRRTYSALHTLVFLADFAVFGLELLISSPGHTHSSTDCMYARHQPTSSVLSDSTTDRPTAIRRSRGHPRQRPPDDVSDETRSFGTSWGMIDRHCPWNVSRPNLGHQIEELISCLQWANYFLINSNSAAVKKRSRKLNCRVFERRVP